MPSLKVNGMMREVTASPETPLLYVLRGELDVMTPKFGCGMAQCGACSVLVVGVETRACITPLSALEGKEVTTVDGLPARWKHQHAGTEPDALHPVQQAWIDESVLQCGICQWQTLARVTRISSRR